MASASKETIFREVTTITEEEEVVLRLSKDEAAVLRIMVSDAHVWGDFSSSDRKHVESVRTAFIDAGGSHQQGERQEG